MSTSGDLSAFASALAHARWRVVTDPAARRAETAKGTAASLAALVRDIDPKLPDDERERQAKALRSEHFRNLGIKSGAARRAKRGSA